MTPHRPKADVGCQMASTKSAAKDQKSPRPQCDSLASYRDAWNVSVANLIPRVSWPN